MSDVIELKFLDQKMVSSWRDNPVKLKEFFNDNKFSNECYTMINHLCVQFTLYHSAPPRTLDAKSVAKKMRELAKKIGVFYANMPAPVLYMSESKYIGPLNTMLQAAVLQQHHGAVAMIYREILEKMSVPYGHCLWPVLNIDIFPLLINNYDNKGMALLDNICQGYKIHRALVGYHKNLAASLVFAVLTKNFRLAHRLIKFNHNYINNSGGAVDLIAAYHAAYKNAKYDSSDKFVQFLQSQMRAHIQFPLPKQSTSTRYLELLKKLRLTCAVLSRYIIAEDKDYTVEIITSALSIYHFYDKMLPIEKAFYSVRLGCYWEMAELLGEVMQLALNRGNYRVLRIIQQETLDKGRASSDRFWCAPRVKLDMMLAVHHLERNTDVAVLNALCHQDVVACAKNAAPNLQFAARYNNFGLITKLLRFQAVHDRAALNIAIDVLATAGANKILQLLANAQHPCSVKMMLDRLSTSAQLTHVQLLELLECQDTSQLLEFFYINSVDNARRIKHLLLGRHRTDTELLRVRMGAVIMAAVCGCGPLINALACSSEFRELAPYMFDVNFKRLIEKGEKKAIMELVLQLSIGSGVENAESIAYALQLGHHSIANFLLTATTPFDIIKTCDALVAHRKKYPKLLTAIYGSSRASSLFCRLMWTLPRNSIQRKLLIHHKAPTVVEKILSGTYNLSGVDSDFSAYTFGKRVSTLLDNIVSYDLKYCQYMGCIIHKTYGEKRMHRDMCNLIFQFARDDKIPWNIEIDDSTKDVLLVLHNRKQLG